MKKRVVAAGIIAAGVLVSLTACGEPTPTFKEQCEALGGVAIEDTELVWQPFTKEAGWHSQTNRQCIGAEVVQ